MDDGEGCIEIIQSIAFSSLGGTEIIEKVLWCAQDHCMGEPQLDSEQ